MKPITIHPGSAILGAGMLALALLSAGAFQQEAMFIGHSFGTRDPVDIRVAGIPDP